MLLVMTDLYWDTCMSFTMSALFHATYLTVTDYLHCNVRFTKSSYQIEIFFLEISILCFDKLLARNRVLSLYLLSNNL